MRCPAGLRSVGKAGDRTLVTSQAFARDCLNILVVQLASTNRQTKEDLKFFQDSGGNIVDHFPPETDYDAHRKLSKEQIKNLDMLVDDPAGGQYLAKNISWKSRENLPAGGHS